MPGRFLRPELKQTVARVVFHGPNFQPFGPSERWVSWPSEKVHRKSEATAANLGFEAKLWPAAAPSLKSVCKKLGITEQTYYRWRKEYGSLRMDQANSLDPLHTILYKNLPMHVN